MKSYNPILFDLDGTLTDPGEGIRNSVAHALNYYGIQMSAAELNRFIGPPLAEGFREFCGFSAGQAAEAVERYREYYREKGMLENRVYDGIPEPYPFWGDGRAELAPGDLLRAERLTAVSTLVFTLFLIGGVWLCR